MVETINNFTSDSGTWILVNENLEVSNSSITQSSYNYTNKWNLAGTNKDININTISCDNEINSIWKYSNNTWLLNTNIENSLNLESFGTIKANEGFWVNCK